MQEVARQMLILRHACAIGFGTEPAQLNLLIDIQNQLRYFLPHILALTTSSPFWHGHPTRLEELSQHHLRESAAHGHPARVLVIQRLS